MATIAESIPLHKEGAAAVEQIKRFDVHQIIQHAGLMTSFIFLVITGLPMKFNSAGVSQWWIGVWGGIENTRSTHHFAAWVMVAVCVYHAAYLFYTLAILKRPFPVKMIPSLKDFTDLFCEMLYFAGIRKDKPQFDRFNWREKMDYWAIFWGMPVMAGSGFIMMYPVAATQYMPGWVVPASLIAHSDEAMLAFTWIFMVHIFFNHFTPGMFPMNTAIFTGKVSRERLQREHPLESQRLEQAAMAEVADGQDTDTPGR